MLPQFDRQLSALRPALSAAQDHEFDRPVNLSLLVFRALLPAASEEDGPAEEGGRVATPRPHAHAVSNAALSL